MPFEASNTPHYCQPLFLYDRVLSFCWAQLLAGVAYWVQPLFSCNSTAATPTPDASILGANGFIRSGSFSTSSCSRYSLSSEYTRYGASLHCTCSDFPFLRRLEALRPQQRLGCGLYSSPLILGRISLVSWWSAPDSFSRIFFSPPNGICKNSYCPSGVTNTVLHTSSGATSICQYPLVKSILDRFSCHWVNRTGLQPSSWVLGLLR